MMTPRRVQAILGAGPDGAPLFREPPPTVLIQEVIPGLQQTSHQIWTQATNLGELSTALESGNALLLQERRSEGQQAHFSFRRPRTVAGCEFSLGLELEVLVEPKPDGYLLLHVETVSRQIVSYQDQPALLTWHQSNTLRILPETPAVVRVPNVQTTPDEPGDIAVVLHYEP